MKKDPAWQATKKKTKEQFTNNGEIGIETTNISNKEIAKQANHTNTK